MKIGDYPFDRLRALLNGQTPSKTVEPISLAIGEPQHEPPAFVRKIIDDNSQLWRKYPLVKGTSEFRDGVVNWIEQRYPASKGVVDPDECVMPVSGTREALFISALAVIPEVKSGKTPAVLIPNPFYQVYMGAAALAGAEAVLVNSTEKNGFLPNFSEQSDEIFERTSLAYYCSPANPQGTVATLQQLQNIILLARERDFVIAFDECYSEIYDKKAPSGGIEACATLGGSLKNVLVFNSLSKRSNVPGLRSGFVAGDPDLISALKTVRDYGGAPPPYPLLAAATALWGDEAHVEENRRLYRAKFDAADQFLAGSHEYFRPAGGFYLWLNVKNGEKAALKLWKEGALRTIPGRYLAKDNTNGDNPGLPYIRCAMVHDIETTVSALTRLKEIL